MARPVMGKNGQDQLGAGDQVSRQRRRMSIWEPSMIPISYCILTTSWRCTSRMNANTAHDGKSRWEFRPGHGGSGQAANAAPIVLELPGASGLSLKSEDIPRSSPPGQPAMAEKYVIGTGICRRSVNGRVSTTRNSKEPDLTLPTLQQGGLRLKRVRSTGGADIGSFRL